MNEYMLEALKEADKAFKRQEVPVGAVLVKNNRIIAKAYNNREKKHNILGHAEILCLQKASKKEKTWKFKGYDLYVTLEPCQMCLEIIKHARVSNIHYLINKDNIKKDYNNTKIQKVEYNKLTISEYKKKMGVFFKKLR